MNHQKAICIVALTCGALTALHVHAQPRCQINDYGVFRREDPIHVYNVATTSRIRAKIGLLFGVAYDFRGIKKDEPIRFRILQSKTAKGPFSSVISDMQITYDDHDDYDEAMIFSFDEPHELKPGIWRFILSARGKNLCTKTFSVSIDGAQAQQ